MASSRRSNLHRGEESTEINISPMIDMVFILLIFFIVTTVFVDESGLDVDKPSPSPNQMDTEDLPIKIQITKNGQVVLDGNDIGLSGVRSNVAARLRKADVPVILELDPAANSGLMVRVMDEAKAAEASRISITATQ